MTGNATMPISGDKAHTRTLTQYLSLILSHTASLLKDGVRFLWTMVRKINYSNPD